MTSKIHQRSTRYSTEEFAKRFRPGALPPGLEEDDMLSLSNEKSAYLIATSLFTECLLKLTYPEFSAVSLSLLMNAAWDPRPDEPKNDTIIGWDRYGSERPLNVSAVVKASGTDAEKYVASLRSALVKMPVLAALLPSSLVRDMETYNVPPASLPEAVNSLPDDQRKKIKDLGNDIRRLLIRGPSVIKMAKKGLNTSR